MRKFPKLVHAWEELAYHNQGMMRWLSPLLLPASVLYGGSQRIRRGMFQSGFIKGMKASVPVISIGNLTLGGVGKTPFTLYIANRLKEMGYTPAILFRGYKRQSNEPIILTKENFQADKVTEYGDEPAMVCFTSGITCGIYRMRSQTAQTLLDNNLCDILLMDDGLQHLQMRRDLDLVLMDGENAVGNHMCLPMGPLREPLQTLSNVHAVVFRDKTSITILPQQFNGKTFLGSLVWQGICPVVVWAEGSFSSVIPVAQYHSESVILVSGIGNPARLEQQAASNGLRIAHHAVYPDHHWISREEIMQAGSLDANLPMLLTEKDAIRLLGMMQELPEKLKQRLHVIQAAWQMNQEDEFAAWLQSTVQSIQNNKV